MTQAEVANELGAIDGPGLVSSATTAAGTVETWRYFGSVNHDQHPILEFENGVLAGISTTLMERSVASAVTGFATVNCWKIFEFLASGDTREWQGAPRQFELPLPEFRIAPIFWLRRKENHGAILSGFAFRVLVSSTRQRCPVTPYFWNTLVEAAHIQINQAKENQAT